MGEGWGGWRGEVPGAFDDLRLHLSLCPGEGIGAKVGAAAPFDSGDERQLGICCCAGALARAKGMAARGLSLCRYVGRALSPSGLLFSDVQRAREGM